MKRREKQVSKELSSKKAIIFSVLPNKKETKKSWWWDRNEPEEVNSVHEVDGGSALEQYMKFSVGHYLSPIDIKVLNQHLDDIRKQFSRVVQQKNDEINSWKKQFHSSERQRHHTEGELSIWKKKFREVLIKLKRALEPEATEEEEEELKDPEDDKGVEITNRKEVIEEYLGRQADRTTYEKDLLEVIMKQKETQESLDKLESEKKVLSTEIDHLASQLKQVSAEKNAIGKELGVQFFRLNMLRKESEHVNKIPSAKRAQYKTSPRKLNNSSKFSNSKNFSSSIKSTSPQKSITTRNPMESQNTDLEKLNRMVSDAKVAHGLQTLQQARMLKKILNRNIHDLFGDVKEYLYMVRTSFDPATQSKDNMASQMDTVDDMRQYLIRKMKGNTDAVLTLQEQLQEAKVYSEEQQLLGAWNYGEIDNNQFSQGENERYRKFSSKKFEKEFPALISGKKQMTTQELANAATEAATTDAEDQGELMQEKVHLEAISKGDWSLPEPPAPEEPVYDYEFEWSPQEYVREKKRLRRTGGGYV
eukprot:gb/GECH01001066.1/.p1 GENE.gb/GECH01001066.1/~~gb/GECH01001066.1/.p1  ORF type:complete len:532 (+),score=174.57 gb/GECH01001066.1/:1-1596(+)